MTVQDDELVNELNSYAGLESFNKNAYERELELCANLGADVEKLKALGFNALQLAEIRKGIADKIDVSKYTNPEMPWTEMEELRLEMSQGIDMSSYREQGFDLQQLSQIRQGIAMGIDVTVYAKPEYLADQMRELRIGLSKDHDVPIIFYQDPSYDSMQMREIRKGLEAGIDISHYASPAIPYMKMRAVRKSAVDGLIFSGGEITKYNANILEQLHLAHLDGVDIQRYIKDNFDAEQLEQIRICLKEGIDIDRHITGDMRGDAIKEIRLGLESGVDVGQYADPSYGWMQMYELRTGLEHQIDISPYAKPLYQADQMREIRLGIEEGLDISKYSTMMYTATDMRRIREKLEKGEITGGERKVAADSPAALDRTEGISDDAVLLNSMLAHKDDYISFSADDMLCMLKLPLRSDGASYTEELIFNFLLKCRIRMGIDKEGIKRMLRHINSGENYVVAAGKGPVDGVDGYYDFFFDTETNNEPIILKDGTADLSNMDTLKQVRVGDKLAYYHRATKGEDGYNVFGEALKARNGKEIPILKGEGFMILNDRVTYVAKYSGAISMVDGVINIQKVMIVPEVKVTDKKINYDGVVYVTGDVHSSSDIKATGDIIIGGHMESSEIVSGGNVIIKGGATCPIRGSITAKGDISAKFFEGVTITGKNISGNYFINCKINSSGLIKTYGRVGIIYGGTCQSLVGIETASVGNRSGAKTIINLGVNGSLLTEYNNIQKMISREEEDLRTLQTESLKLQEAGAVDRQKMQWKIKINAAIGMKEAKIKELSAKKIRIQAEIDKGSAAQAVISEVAYAGTIFVIDGIVLRIENDRKTYDKMIVKANAQKDAIEII